MVAHEGIVVVSHVVVEDRYELGFLLRNQGFGEQSFKKITGIDRIFVYLDRVWEFGSSELRA